jgi:hypothetical protein
MATGSIAEEFTMAVPADLLWKETFSHDATTLKKTFAGLVDDVEINGDGGPGSLVTMKFNPGIVVYIAYRRTSPACRRWSP